MTNGRDKLTAKQTEILARMDRYDNDGAVRSTQMSAGTAGVLAVDAAQLEYITADEVDDFASWLAGNVDDSSEVNIHLHSLTFRDSVRMARVRSARKNRANAVAEQAKVLLQIRAAKRLVQMLEQDLETNRQARGLSTLSFTPFDADALNLADATEGSAAVYVADVTKAV